MLFGVLGYIILQDYNLIDAFYMTVITITTVGFREVKQLDDVGKIFTSILLLFSIGSIAYSLSIISSVVFEGKLKMYFRDVKNRKEIKKMKNHTIIVGYGRNGKQAAHELKLHKENYLVIDSDVKIGEDITDKTKWMHGDATIDEVLIEGGVKDAKALISALPNDADNLYITVSARGLNPKIRIISRASSESSERKLHAAGANYVIMPEKVGGIYMAGFIAQPDLAEFMNRLRIDHDTPGRLMEIDCSLIPENLLEKTIKELQIKTTSGVNIVGIKLIDDNYIINPVSTTKIKQSSKLFVMGTDEQLKQLYKILEI